MKLHFFIRLFLCYCISSVPYLSASAQCDSWLYIAGGRSGADIGFMQISGNELTVECLFNRTTSWDPIAQGGDLVSNHCSPNQLNYLLRPNSAQITTTNGFFAATDFGPIALNTTYHVAMVYNGSTLTLYRNGIQVAQTAATGMLTYSGFTTRIGRTGCLEADWQTDFIGYINEVRIWDIVRTPAEITSAMSTILANPQVQPGLQSYHTFNSLTNKVRPTVTAHTTGTLFGTMASLSATNPNVGSFNICGTAVTSAPPPLADAGCNTYLQVAATNSGVQIGNVAIPGNQLTVEAIFTRTQPYDATYGGGDLVSKHCFPTDASYLLRPNHAAIRIGGTLYVTPAPPCNIQLNQTYHVAMVYNGSTLRFYRNGELLSSIAASGNLAANTWQTMIGTISCLSGNPEEFIGYINEVRIWNTARRSQELSKYRFKQLDNPAVQPGLVAYYHFNSLNNLQGNTAYNGVLYGTVTPTINQTNPQCNAIGGTCSCSLCRTQGETNIDTFSHAGGVKNIEEKSKDEPFAVIQPNPAREFINVYSSATNIQSWIISGPGNILKQQLLNKGYNRIYVGDIPKGMYFLKAIKNNKTLSRKFIKL